MIPIAPRVLAFAACVATAATCESFTDVIGPTHYSAVLTGANVKPAAVVTPASGTITASWNPVTGRLSYTMGWSGMTSAAVSAHIHGPASENNTAGVLVDFEVPPDGSTGQLVKGTTGSATGELDVTRAVTPTVSGDSLVRLLQAGLLYVDVHTGTNVNGEVRGQLREN